MFGFEFLVQGACVGGEFWCLGVQGYERRLETVTAQCAGSGKFAWRERVE